MFSAGWLSGIVIQEVVLCSPPSLSCLPRFPAETYEILDSYSVGGKGSTSKIDGKLSKAEWLIFIISSSF